VKQDLFFILEKLTSSINQNRPAMLARQHGIGQKRDAGGEAKTFAAFVRRPDDEALSRLLVETAILASLM
jgi:ParB family chromosome partitioning protein